MPTIFVVLQVNLTELNDGICQSTPSWIQNDSVAPPRSDAVVKATGPDIIFVAAVCVVVGLPVLSFVMTFIVISCRLNIQ
jgi:hypothetical protein